MVLKQISKENFKTKNKVFCIVDFKRLSYSTKNVYNVYNEPCIYVDEHFIQSSANGAVHNDAISFFNKPYSWKMDGVVSNIRELDHVNGRFYRISDFISSGTGISIKPNYDTIALVHIGNSFKLVFYKASYKAWYVGNSLFNEEINISNSYIFLNKEDNPRLEALELYQLYNNIGFIRTIATNTSIFYGIFRDEIRVINFNKEIENKNLIKYEGVVQLENKGDININQYYIERSFDDYISTDGLRPVSIVSKYGSIIRGTCADFIKDSCLRNFVYYYPLKQVYRNGFTIEDIKEWVSFISNFVECDLKISPVKEDKVSNSFNRELLLPIEFSNCINYSNYSNYLRIILLRYILSPNHGIIPKLTMDIYKSLHDDYNITQWQALLMAHYCNRGGFIDDSLGIDPEMSLNFETLSNQGREKGVNQTFKNKKDISLSNDLFKAKDYKSIYITLKEKYDTL